MVLMPLIIQVLVAIGKLAVHAFFMGLTNELLLLDLRTLQINLMWPKIIFKKKIKSKIFLDFWYLNYVQVHIVNN
jgi:hypothetical protein